MLKALKDKGGSNLSLENVLISKKLLTQSQLEEIHRFMEANDVNFSTAAMFLKMLTTDELARLFSRARIQTVRPETVPVSARFKSMLPPEKARELQVFPLNLIEDSGQNYLLLAMTDPTDTASIVKVEQLSRLKVQAVFIGLEDLEKLYRKFYHGGMGLFPPEFTGSFDSTAQRRLDSVLKGRTKSERTSKTQKKTEVDALISLLIKKRLITKEEFTRELNER